MPSCMSNLWMLHQHRDPHGKQLGNLMHLLGSAPEARVPQLSVKIRRHHSLTLLRWCIFIHPETALSLS